MSNNIHDTNIYVIKTQVDDMIKDILENNIKDKDILESKYDRLFNTSKTLFNRIYKDTTQNSFDKDSFYKNLNHMLKLIFKIQKSEISQHKASEEIGTSLAKQYIPSLQEKPPQN